MSEAPLPLRMEAGHVRAAAQQDDVRRRVARILWIAEAAECWLNEHRGSQLDRDQVLDFIDLIAEQAEAAQLPRVDFSSGQSGQEARP